MRPFVLLVAIAALTCDHAAGDRPSGAHAGAAHPSCGAACAQLAGLGCVAAADCPEWARTCERATAERMIRGWSTACPAHARTREEARACPGIACP